MKPSLFLPATLSLLMLLLTPACSDDRYYWTEVPYCKVPDGNWAGHFTQPIRVLTKHSKGGGTSSLSGMRPLRSVEFSQEILVAIVACTSQKNLVEDLDKFQDEFSESKVPQVCPGQRVLVRPTLAKKLPSEKYGFAGALLFPRIDPNELTCDQGVLSLGTE